MDGRRSEPRANILRTLHVVSTTWFIVCIGFVLLNAARQAGIRWWLIFSLSGYSAVLLFILLSLYLFTIFRGLSMDPHLAAEHPLTSSQQYNFLYTIAPFLGGITGCLAGIGIDSRIEVFYRAAIGTFVATFAGWVIADPAIAVLEGLLPASRRHKAQRLAREQAIREQLEQERQRLLGQVIEAQNAQRHAWQGQLQLWSNELIGLICSQDPQRFWKARAKAVEIGAKAWQMGGLNCMQQLYNSIASQDQGPLAEYLQYWWDGIGAWRGPNL